MLLKILEKNIRSGILHLHMPDGHSYRFGDHGIEAHWYIKDQAVTRRIATDWEFQMGETYTRGLWDCGSHELGKLLAVLRANFASSQVSRWLQPYSALLQWNKITRSYANVAHHYDVPEGVFRKFLDQEMFYSCAYFAQEAFTLEQAQQAKARHIAEKLLLEPGQKILDIGCGWGSMAFYLAQHYDCEVVGITLSKEQLAVAEKEAQKRAVKNVRFQLADYREHQGLYDRIVSIGMFEHVGKPFYATYFRRIREMLTASGIALVHSIGRSGPPGITNPWIRKYIFPGGSTPALSEIASGVELSGLMSTDIEVWRLHYARTLHHWLERFQHNRAAIRAIMSEEFCRMWEFYLAACEASFEYSNLVVYQLQLARQHGSVPITRDYLYQEK
ncbi:MAG: cyclopropane-fatty-acyl-phospholipid synthase family protein [Pseudomonadales bacterium]|nr:cyclopropane-fatty-acyl-phospholipid synthase family protein [Pseudomonadales bacterium]